MFENKNDFKKMGIAFFVLGFVLLLVLFIVDGFGAGGEIFLWFAMAMFAISSGFFWQACHLYSQELKKIIN